MSRHIHEDIWHERAWAPGKYGGYARVSTGRTKIVRYVKVGLDQAQVLHKAGVTLYKWKKARRSGCADTGFRAINGTWWVSFHLELCRRGELSRLHAGNVHPKTLAAIKRGTVSYCVLVDGDEVQTG